MEDATTAAQKIFFSYSRTDGQGHALKLAGDLRAAGANVWIDQLDIELGKLWDLEVEKALNTADCVLFIATEKSTTSNNVLNEVYYALDENKKVIPVVFHDCRIPFQLRRLQRIDFTADYNTAFERLMKALGLTAGKATATPTPTKHVEEPTIPSTPTVAETEAIKGSPKEPRQERTETDEHFTANEQKMKEPKQKESVFTAEKPETPSVDIEGTEKPKVKKALLWGVAAVAAAAIVFVAVKNNSGSASNTEKTGDSAMVLSKTDGTAPLDSFSVLTQNTPQTKTDSGMVNEDRNKTTQSGNEKPPETSGVADNETRFNEYRQSGLHKFTDKDFKGAIDDLLKALAVKPDAEVSFQIGRCYGLLEDYANAAAYYSKAIDADPKNWVYHNGRGNAYRKAANYTAAVSDYNQAVLLAPKEGLPYANRGLCKQALNDAAGACQDFSTAMNLGEETGKAAYNSNCLRKPSFTPALITKDRITLKPSANGVKKYQKAVSPRKDY